MALDRAVREDPIDQLQDQEIERYARHLVLPELGVAAQLALRAAHMAVIGCGGLGANLALALAQAGVGRLDLYDPDTVALSNLPRQPFTQTQIGEPKAQALADLCRARNDGTQCMAHIYAFAGNPAPIWLDCTDTDASRRAVCALRAADTWMVFGSVLALDAQITVFAPGSLGFTGLYPHADTRRQTCADVGVLAPLVGVTAQVMATEALRLAVKQDSVLQDHVLLIDARDWRHQLFRRPDMGAGGMTS